MLFMMECSRHKAVVMGLVLHSKTYVYTTMIS